MKFIVSNLEATFDGQEMEQLDYIQAEAGMWKTPMGGHFFWGNHRFSRSVLRCLPEGNDLKFGIQMDSTLEPL